jgi:uncharacterized protein YoxC
VLQIDPTTASELVRLVLNQSGFHAIICDDSGTIIADSADTRVGTLHDGARRLLTTTIESIEVSADDAEASGGTMKEGFSLAIKAGRTKIGTFGVAGPLAIVEPIAKIAAGLVIARLKDRETAAAIRQHVGAMNASLKQAAKASEVLAAASAKLAGTSQSAEALTRETALELQKTTEILDQIKRVAEQTKLLSFNAAIEAGRAGDAGRGFAVVAGEIRKLSDESQLSAAAIAALLGHFGQSVEKLLEDVRVASSIAHEQARSSREIAAMVEGLSGIGRAMVQSAGGKNPGGR